MVTSSLPGIPGDDILLPWTRSETEATKDALQDAEFHRDCAAIEAILDTSDDVPGITRRGAHLYTWRRTSANPRGIWQRTRDGAQLTGETEWETAFDLDAFCAETGQIWHWRGARSAWFNPELVLLCLSLNGSDQVRYVEFDLSALTFVEGGFDLPAARLDPEWLGPDTLIVAESVTDGAATKSGWPGRIRELQRGQAMEDGDIVFEVAHEDLLAVPAITSDANNDVVICLSRMIAIGQEECTIRRPGRPDLRLPMPKDAECISSGSHFSFVVQKEGGTPGALMLGAFDGKPPRTVYTPGPGEAVASQLLMRDWLLFKTVDSMKPALWALSLTDPEVGPKQIEVPGGADDFWVFPLDDLHEQGDQTLVISMSGFLMPRQMLSFSLENGLSDITWTPVWQTPHAFDAKSHEVSLHWATSEDGTQVPYHLVAPKEATDVPTLVYGYGGYGVSLSPYYGKITGKLWLEKGGAYVMAYIRGGSELGPDWHLQAKGAGRDKAFADFVAVSRDLVARGVTRPERIACHGGSNGGLLCGVMLTRCPQDFGAVWASVGVYDMLKFHEFEAGAAWIDEYGDPDDPEAAKWLQSYSPLHHIAGREDSPYPPALIDTSSSDDRVHPSHSRWFGWQLRQSGQTLYYAEHSDGGHGGGGATSAIAAEQALGHAFLRQTIGKGKM